jgi:hypothetical protein
MARIKSLCGRMRTRHPYIGVTRARERLNWDTRPHPSAWPLRCVASPPRAARPTDARAPPGLRFFPGPVAYAGARPAVFDRISGFRFRHFHFRSRGPAP